MLLSQAEKSGASVIIPTNSKPITLKNLRIAASNYLDNKGAEHTTAAQSINSEFVNIYAACEPLLNEKQQKELDLKEKSIFGETPYKRFKAEIGLRQLHRKDLKEKKESERDSWERLAETHMEADLKESPLLLAIKTLIASILLRIKG